MKTDGTPDTTQIPEFFTKKLKPEQIWSEQPKANACSSTAKENYCIEDVVSVAGISLQMNSAEKRFSLNPSLTLDVCCCGVLLAFCLQTEFVSRKCKLPIIYFQKLKYEMSPLLLDHMHTARTWCKESTKIIEYTQNIVMSRVRKCSSTARKSNLHNQNCGSLPTWPINSTLIPPWSSFFPGFKRTCT